MMPPSVATWIACNGPNYRAARWETASGVKQSPQRVALRPSRKAAGPSRLGRLRGLSWSAAHFGQKECSGGRHEGLKRTENTKRGGTAQARAPQQRPAGGAASARQKSLHCCAQDGFVRGTLQRIAGAMAPDRANRTQLRVWHEPRLSFAVREREVEIRR